MNRFASSVLLFLGLAALCSAGVVTDFQGRIVGSSPAAPGQFPHMVSLRTTANAHVCGGFIHNSRWVVTAAHCTLGRTVGNTVAVVGAHTLTDGTSHPLSAIRTHPNYNANMLFNDIAVLQTANEIVMNARVQPIPLGSVTLGAVDAVSSGWGFTTWPGNQLASQLMFVNTRTLTNEDCRSRFNTINANKVVDNKICVFSGAGIGNCSGDSGNPLISGGTVIGSASWGLGCAQGNPYVYSRISSHRDWILMAVQA